MNRFHDYQNATSGAGEEDRDDFRFVYMGPAGSWTPFHRDVFRSHSWSANLTGRKLWLMFPPAAEPCLVSQHGGCVYDVLAAMAAVLGEADGTNDKETETAMKRFHAEFPRFREALPLCRVVWQNAGQVIFVPSVRSLQPLPELISLLQGWFHQVINVEDVVSINHNWGNGLNLPRMWAHLRSEREAVV
jgi:hypothetical protein